MAPLPTSARLPLREAAPQQTPPHLVTAYDRSPSSTGQLSTPQSADSDSDAVTNSPDPSTTATDYGDELVVPPFMYLDLSNQHLDDLPLPHCHYQALNISSNGLSHVPHSLFRHYATIRILVLSFNHLTDLPLDLVTLHSLTELYLNNNQLTHVPRCLGELRHLEVLDLSCNRLQALNYCLTRLQALRELDVSHNQLHEVPSYLGLLYKSLKSLGVSDNPLTKDASELFQPLIFDAPIRPYARISHWHSSPEEPGALHATRLAPSPNRPRVLHRGTRIPRNALQNPLSFDLAPQSDCTTASTESNKYPEPATAKPRGPKFARNPLSIFKPMKRAPSGSKRLHRHPKLNIESLAPSLTSSPTTDPLTPPATATPITLTPSTQQPALPLITPEPLGPTSPQTPWATTQAHLQHRPTVRSADATSLFSDPGVSEPATESTASSPDLAIEVTWSHPTSPALARQGPTTPERPPPAHRRASLSALMGDKNPGASSWRTSSGESLSTPTSPGLPVVASPYRSRHSLDRSQPTLLKKALINDHSHLHSLSSSSLPTGDLDKPRSNRRWYSFWSAKRRSHREQQSAPTSPVELLHPKRRPSSRRQKPTRLQRSPLHSSSTTPTVEASPHSDYYSATSAASTQLQRANSTRPMTSVRSAPPSPAAQSAGSSQWEDVFFTPASQNQHYGSYFPLTFPRTAARTSGRTNRTITPRSGQYASPPLSPHARKPSAHDTPQQWSTKPEQDDPPTMEAPTPTSSLHSPSLRSSMGAASESRDNLPRVLDDPSALLMASASQVTPSDKLAAEVSQPTHHHRQISPLALATGDNSKVLSQTVSTSSTPSSSPASKAYAANSRHRPQLSVSSRSTMSNHSEATAGTHSGASQLSVETSDTDSQGVRPPLGDHLPPPLHLLQNAGLRLKPSRSDITNKQSAPNAGPQPTPFRRQHSYDHFPPKSTDGPVSAEYNCSVADGHLVIPPGTDAHHPNQSAPELSVILNLMRDKWDLDPQSSESNQLQWHVKHGPMRVGDQTAENKLALHRQSADPFNALVQYPINDTSTLNSNRSAGFRGKQSSTNSSLTDVAGSEPTKSIDPEKRRLIFQELIDTERTYVDCLRRLVKIYIGPIDPTIAQHCQVSLAPSPSVARGSTTSLPHSSEISLLSEPSHASAKQSFSSQLSDNVSPTTLTAPSDPYLPRAGTAGPTQGLDSELASATRNRRSSSTAVPEGHTASTNGFLQQLSATAAQFKPPPLSTALPSALMRPPRLITDGLSDWPPTKYRHLLSSVEIRTLFGNADTLLMFHRDHLLTDLEACVADPSHPVGKVFLRNAAFLRLYSVYVNNYDNATTKLDEWTKHRKKFAKYLSAAQSHPEHNQLNLLGYLLLPIQRVPRYEMLLRQLLQHTPISHPDYSDLCKALTVVKERAGEINEKKREYERSVRMVQIANYIHGSYRINLVQPHRRFIRRGMLFLDTAVTTTTKLHKYPLGVKTHKVGLDFYFFLFNDLLLQCTKSEHSGCQLLKTLQLQTRVAPAELMQDPTMLRLVDETGIYYLRAKPGEAERWVSALNNRFAI